MPLPLDISWQFYLKSILPPHQTVNSVLFRYVTPQTVKSKVDLAGSFTLGSFTLPRVKLPDLTQIFPHLKHALHYSWQFYSWQSKTAKSLLLRSILPRVKLLRE